jgi:hypothetical protein
MLNGTVRNIGGESRGSLVEIVYSSLPGTPRHDFPSTLPNTVKG